MMSFFFGGITMTLHKRWTQEQKALLEQLYSDINRSWEELAEMLGHSQSSIQSQASKLGLCRPHPTLNQERWLPEQVELLMRLHRHYLLLNIEMPVMSVYPAKK
jgi:1,2-phenylacetyl-CoA epoxidase catalytic subunit